MRAIVQRVMAGSVRVDGREVGRCGQGLVLLVGVRSGDRPEEAKKLASKIANLRIFNDPTGKMNLSILDVESGGTENCSKYEYDILAVSNFTVYGDATKSRRPSFSASAPFEEARLLFDQFVVELKMLGISVQTGVFGADMQVSILNDGPVTLTVDVEAPAIA